MNASASRREERLEQSEARERKNLGLMSNETRQKAIRLASIWQKNALIQFSIRWQRNKENLTTVKNLRPQWYTADFKMKAAEKEALRLGTPAYEYFASCKERFFISQEEKDDKGDYCSFPDYSELRRQWYTGEPITVPLPFAWDHMLQICQQYSPTGREDHSSRTETIRFIVNITLALASIGLTIFFGLGGV